jgi:hypothetical protein
MNATTNQTQIGRIETERQINNSAEGYRVAQSTLLSELPGMVFAVLTLAYVASSLIALV